MKIVNRSTRIFLNSQKFLVSGLIKINRRNYAQSSGLSYIHNIGKQPLVYRTIGQQLTRAANEFGDREAVVCIEERTKFTYEQLRSEADRLAAGFQCLGLTRGDRVGIWAPNVAIWPVRAYKKEILQIAKEHEKARELERIQRYHMPQDVKKGDKSEYVEVDEREKMPNSEQKKWEAEQLASAVFKFWLQGCEFIATGGVRSAAG
uniref:AMP-dependent synthetase/ligase domain-containing protein n=1 Tax=Lutzomyia longipalpis TaxID=7200 RepID=A0A1B0CWZ9_LUTLO